MKDIKLRTKVAELAGWSFVGQSTENEVRGFTGDTNHPSYHKYPIVVPEYESDLNAMAEAEKCLTDEKIRFLYEATLHSLNTKYGLGISAWETVHASAQQRAEAFVKVFTS